MFFLIVSIILLALSVYLAIKLAKSFTKGSNFNESFLLNKSPIITIVVLLFISLISYQFGYNTPERKEDRNAKYLNTVFSKLQEIDSQLDGFSSVSSREEAKKFAASLKKKEKEVKNLNAPRALPEWIEGSVDTAVDGYEYIFDGLKTGNTLKFQKGRDTLTSSARTWVNYLENHESLGNKITQANVDWLMENY